MERLARSSPEAAAGIGAFAPVLRHRRFCGCGGRIAVPWREV